MCARMECRILTSKNWAKLKQYYFHAEFLEEVRYYNLDLLATKEHVERLQHKLEEQLKKSRFAATTSALGICIHLYTIAIMRGNFGL